MAKRQTGRTVLAVLMAVCLCSGALVRPVLGYQLFTNANGNNYTWNLSGGNVVKWNLAEGTPELVRESMYVVTRAWTVATNGVLRFQEEPGGIELLWDETGAKIADPIYLAYTIFNADVNQNIVISRVVINASNYTWQRGGYTGVGPEIDGKREANLDSVLMHEIGHAIGIDHSDKNPAAIVGVVSSTDLPTMNSVIFPGAESLHLDDETAARKLYQAPEPDTTPMIVVGSPTRGQAPLDVGFTQAGGDEHTVWNFGDGTTTMGAAPTHLFNTPGTYAVTASFNGRSGTATIVVEKKDPKVARQEALEKKRKQRQEEREKQRQERLAKKQRNAYRYADY